jgi:Fe-S cluster assembly protein SufD
MPRRKQFVDNHTKVDHRLPHCNSNELYKGVLNDQSTGVFNGKVYVHIDAQKTNAYQSNANIMMSDNASMFTKPELEIYADDVKCSHGSTTGQFDEEALFYLRARGLSEESAKRLLVSAFTSDVMNRISIPSWKEYVLATLIQNEIITE